MRPNYLQKFKNILNLMIKKIKNLEGNPHYVALGMASGVFIASTPTIPFHTALAILLATIINGSKPAAIIGVWFSNPITIPQLYIGSYKIGILILSKIQSSVEISQIRSITDMMKIGFDLTLAMIIGGMILGIIPTILAYIITRWAFTNMKKKFKKMKTTLIEKK